MIVYVGTCPDHKWISGMPMGCRHGQLTGTGSGPLGRLYLAEPREFRSWDHAARVVLGWKKRKPAPTSSGPADG